jgi:hypothetical protein
VKDEQLDLSSYEPDLDAIARGEERALARVAAIMIADLFALWRKPSAMPSERAKYSQELRLWVAERRAIDEHEGKLRLEQMRAENERMDQLRREIRGTTPSGAEPPQRTRPVDGVH